MTYQRYLLVEDGYKLDKQKSFHQQHKTHTAKGMEMLQETNLIFFSIFQISHYLQVVYASYKFTH